MGLFPAGFVFPQSLQQAARYSSKMLDFFLIPGEFIDRLEARIVRKLPKWIWHHMESFILPKDVQSDAFQLTVWLQCNRTSWVWWIKNHHIRVSPFASACASATHPCCRTQQSALPCSATPPAADRGVGTWRKAPWKQLYVREAAKLGVRGVSGPTGRRTAEWEPDAAAERQTQFLQTPAQFGLPLH